MALGTGVRMVDVWTGRMRESIGERISDPVARQNNLATFAEVIAKWVNYVCERQQRRHGSRPATGKDRSEPLADGKGSRNTTDQR